MPEISRHPNKDIQEAIGYAVLRGWRIEKAGPRAHTYGAAHFAQNRVETDTFSTFILRQKIQLLMHVSCGAMLMLVHTTGNEEDASL